MGCSQSSQAGPNDLTSAPAGSSSKSAGGSSSSDASKFDNVFKIGKELGTGNYSVVKLATHRQTGEKCAVKCIKRADLPREDEEALQMEVEILGSMDHPNIVCMKGFYKEKHFYFLVMELLEGGELFDRIVVKQYYSEKEARDVLKVLLQAIDYCHDRNVVHRDLKPENLLLVSEDDNANIKVADFGFARETATEGLRTQCGTPGYVAPEILRGLPYGKEVDIWSIGVITFILLGGYPPFHDENKALLYKKIKKGKVVFHPQYWDQVSNEAKDLIRKMLTLDTTERITAKQALQHPWILGDDALLAGRELGKNFEQLKLFNARRKFKSAISSVILAQRLIKLGESGTVAAGSSEKVSETQGEEKAGE